jgi:hypothetical protein
MLEAEAGITAAQSSAQPLLAYSKALVDLHQASKLLWQLGQQEQQQLREVQLRLLTQMAQKLDHDLVNTSQLAPGVKRHHRQTLGSGAATEQLHGAGDTAVSSAAAAGAGGKPTTAQQEAAGGPGGVQEVPGMDGSMALAGNAAQQLSASILNRMVSYAELGGAGPLKFATYADRQCRFVLHYTWPFRTTVTGLTTALQRSAVGSRPAGVTQLQNLLWKFSKPPTLAATLRGAAKEDLVALAGLQLPLKGVGQDFIGESVLRVAGGQAALEADAGLKERVQALLEAVRNPHLIVSLQPDEAAMTSSAVARHQQFTWRATWNGDVTVPPPELANPFCRSQEVSHSCLLPVHWAPVMRLSRAQGQLGVAAAGLGMKACMGPVPCTPTQWICSPLQVDR